MSLELTNLLPQERYRGIRRLYFIRLGVVALLALAGVLLVHGVLLLPSYLYLDQQVRDREQTLSALSAKLAGTEEQQVTARVNALADDANYLNRLASTTTASNAIRALIMLPRPGIQILGFSYTPPKKGGDASLILSGVADSRENLRRYEQLLASQPYIGGTNLPISAYAKEKNINFSITLTGTLVP